jgi:hypothetical protein
MTQEHLNALCAAAEVRKTDQGFLEVSDGRSLTLYLAAGGATLTVGRVQSLRQEGELLHCRTAKGEHFIVALQDAYAGSVDAPTTSTKKAGF